MSDLVEDYSLEATFSTVFHSLGVLIHTMFRDYFLSSEMFLLHVYPNSCLNFPNMRNSYISVIFFANISKFIVGMCFKFGLLLLQVFRPLI